MAASIPPLLLKASLLGPPASQILARTHIVRSTTCDISQLACCPSTSVSDIAGLAVAIHGRLRTVYMLPCGWDEASTVMSTNKDLQLPLGAIQEDYSYCNVPYERQRPDGQRTP
jgi:hypothetical protein